MQLSVCKDLNTRLHCGVRQNAGNIPMLVLDFSIFFVSDISDALF